MTVVGQGLTLPWLIRRLGVTESGSEEAGEELKARLVIAAPRSSAVESRGGGVDSGRNDRPGPRPLRVPAAPLQGPGGKIDDEDGIEERARLPAADARIYAAQRSALVRLRNEHEISAEVMRRVERELDLEESRLEV